MRDGLPVEELRFLRGVVDVTHAYSLHEGRRERARAYLTRRIAEAQPLAMYAFQPQPDGLWLVGIPGQAKLLRPKHPKGFEITHQVFAHPDRHIKPHPSAGAARVAARRAADEIEPHCEPLADAMRSIVFRRCGMYYDDPGLIAIAT